MDASTIASVVAGVMSSLQTQSQAPATPSHSGTQSTSSRCVPLWFIYVRTCTKARQKLLVSPQLVFDKGCGRVVIFSRIYFNRSWCVLLNLEVATFRERETDKIVVWPLS